MTFILGIWEFWESEKSYNFGFYPFWVIILEKRPSIKFFASDYASSYIYLHEFTKIVEISCKRDPKMNKFKSVHSSLLSFL